MKLSETCRHRISTGGLSPRRRPFRAVNLPMKRIYSITATLVWSASALGQVIPPSDFDDMGPAFNPPPVPAVELNWQVAARDELSTTWEATESITDPSTGLLSTRPHQFVEIGSGLNYFDPASGGYVPSQDLIELTPNGGAASV
jgi:hypothetical protein